MIFECLIVFYGWLEIFWYLEHLVSQMYLRNWWVNEYSPALEFPKNYLNFSESCLESISNWKRFNANENKARTIPAGTYLSKVNNRNSRTMWENSSNLTIKTPEGRQCRRSGAFVVNSVQISLIVLALPLFNLVNAIYFIFRIYFKWTSSRFLSRW